MSAEAATPAVVPEATAAAAEGADEEAVAAEGQLVAVDEPVTYEALLLQCQELCEKGDFSDAVSAAEEALVLAKESDDKTLQVTALCTLCQTQSRNGDNERALDTAKQMRTFCHDIKVYDGEAQALVEIASIHLSEHQAKPAVRAAGAAVKLCAKNVEPEVKLVALCALAEGCLQLLVDYNNAVYIDARLQREMDQMAAKAFAAVQEAMKVSDELEEFSLRARALFWYSRVVLIFKGKEQEGLEAAAKAKFLYQKAGDKLQEGEALIVLAQAYHKIEPKSQWASNAAHDALEIFQKLDNTPAKERTYLLFQELGIALRVAGGAGIKPAAVADGAAPAAADGAPAAAAASEVAQQSKGLDPEMVMHSVQEMAKAAIGLDDELFLDSPLMDSGMDSLTAVSFRNGLQQNLGVKLPSSLMFDYPTMKDVANRIVELSLEDE